MDETDALRSKRCNNDDAVSLAPSTTESIMVEGEPGLRQHSVWAFRECVRASQGRGRRRRRSQLLSLSCGVCGSEDG